MLKTLVATGFILLFTASLVAAAEATPVTDPALLEAMGIEGGTTGVYASTEVLRAMEQAGRPEPEVEASRADRESPFGTVAKGYSSAIPADFQGTNPEFAGWISGDFTFSCHGTGFPFADAPLDLPHGASLKWLDVWGYDASAENLTFWLYSVCLPDFSAANSTRTILVSGTSSGSGGFFFRQTQFGAGVTVDNQSCHYKVRVRFDDGSSTCSEGFNLAIQKMRVEWARQVSPAPGTATFNDVPTGHPFFQHIEALAASGITAGCGESTFCPDQNLTRGQMAVFLAKALGLHWATF